MQYDHLSRADLTNKSNQNKNESINVIENNSINNSNKIINENNCNEFKSYIPAEQSIPEFTAKAVVVGIIIGIVFGSANAYLGLKVGLTVSASIPAAVMAVAIFKLFFSSSTILETNIVQTIGSAGESLAAGVIFTIPALFMWNVDPSKLDIAIIAIIGGILGVVFMIFLRANLIVKEHGKLPYPEGTACAEVLIAGQGDVEKAKKLFAGIVVGGLYQLLMHDKVFNLWNKEPYTKIPGYKGAEISAEITPELLGIGYIIGPKISAMMLAGGILGWLVLIPIIYLFGEQLNNVIPPENNLLISQMEPIQIWSRYIRYIGAGGVAFAGIFSLIKSIPLILISFKEGIKNFSITNKITIRTQQDVSYKIIFSIIAIISIVLSIYLKYKFFNTNYLASFISVGLILIFGFFFVTVSSRVVGLVGSSSNPISGMTIATLIVTCLFFIFTDMHLLPNARIVALTIGAFVCIAAAIAGDTSQDLKTGYLVGATPKWQQIGEIIGVVTSGVIMGYVIYMLKEPIESGLLPAPQANLMRLVIDGVLGQNLPWTLVISGVFIAFCMELLGINSLAFAVGLYLPLSLSVPVMIGGVIRWVADFNIAKKTTEAEVSSNSGVLYSSGLIAGSALIGVIIMFLIGLSEKFPTIFEKISRPGIYIYKSLPNEIWYVNNKIIDESYYKIPLNLFPDNFEIQLKINELKKKISNIKSSENLNTQDIKLYEEELSNSYKKLKENSTLKLNVKCSYNNQILESEIELEKWQKVYLSLKDNKIIISHLPKDANLKSVIAFTLLSISLLWYAKFKKVGKSA